MNTTLKLRALLPARRCHDVLRTGLGTDVRETVRTIRNHAVMSFRNVLSAAMLAGLTATASAQAPQSAPRSLAPPVAAPVQAPAAPAAPRAPLAGEILLAPAPGTPEDGIARTVFAGFLAANPTAVLRVVRADVDGDGVAEVVVRLVSSSTCAGDRCSTYVLSMDRTNGRWEPVFERRTSSLRLGRMPDGANALVTDLNEIWMRKPNGDWVATLRGMGTEVWVVDPATPAQLAAARAALPRTEVEGSSDATSAAANIDVTPGLRLTVVKLGGAQCGPVVGCPAVILIPERNGLRPVYRGHVLEMLSVLRETTRDMPDIGLQDSTGYRVLKWNGTAYELSRTSYVSAVTRTP